MPYQDADAAVPAEEDATSEYSSEDQPQQSSAETYFESRELVPLETIQEQRQRSSMKAHKMETSEELETFPELYEDAPETDPVEDEMSVEPEDATSSYERQQQRSSMKTRTTKPETTKAKPIEPAVEQDSFPQGAEEELEASPEPESAENTSVAETVEELESTGDLPIQVEELSSDDAPSTTEPNVQVVAPKESVMKFLKLEYDESGSPFLVQEFKSPQQLTVPDDPEFLPEMRNKMKATSYGYYFGGR